MIRKQAGFTLLEVLLVVASLAVLAGIVVVATNPAKQIEDIRNTDRRTDVNNILNVTWQYAIDNNGNFPTGLDNVTSTAQVIGTDSTGCDSSCGDFITEATCVDLSQALVPSYIEEIPFDPQTGSLANTDYYINVDENGRLTVGACDMEESASFSITR